MAQIDIDKVRTAIECRMDGREQPDLTTEENQVVDNYLTRGDDEPDLSEDVTNALASLRESFYAG